MGLLDRLKLWRFGRKNLRLTLGAVPLPSIIPDAEAGLKEIYSIHTKKGYRLAKFWEVLVLSADKETYSMQFFPIVGSPQDCLAIARRGRHIIRFMPIVGNPEELDRIYKGLAGKETFELTFRTDMGMMSRNGLRSIGALSKRSQ
jgi:hypothetical protein